MSVVAVCEAPGTSAATTTGFVLAASVPKGQAVVFSEVDATGGDVPAWCGLREQPGWSTAVASGDQSWAGLQRHLQQVPSGLSVLCAPTRSNEARVVVRESVARFGPLLSSMPDVVTFADCGRVVDEVPGWVAAADLVLLVVRQSQASVGATIARVDRAVETAGLLDQTRRRVGLVVVGARPYGPDQIAESAGLDLIGTLPEDPVGAGLAAGAWTVGRGAARSALARAARPLSARVVSALTVPGEVVPVESRSEESA